MICCPSDERLVKLLEERLDEDELAEIEQHLESCAHCQEVLEALTDDSGTYAGWRPPGGASRVPHAAPDAIALTLWDGRDETRMRLTASAAHPTHFPGRAGPSDADPPACSVPVKRAQRRGVSREGPADWPSVAGYDILEHLGEGGMGVVFKARQHRLSRLVALKMIRAGSQGKPEHLARFRFEAEAVARLHHPNIVHIYDIGEVGGLPFFALELLEGGSLEARVAGTPQPERPAAELLTTLATAMHAAHQAGIVHRDLKSTNVLFAADGTPRITDFGLAKCLDAEDGQTTTGQVLGSPSFMAPEQARGQTDRIGPAADVYALGAILYEMLTGRPPFKGTTPMETVYEVIHKEPVAPSRLRPKLSRDLETICLKCLVKEPHQRYASAGALADDLGRFLAGEPIRARRTSLRERGWKWARREPAAAALVALALTTVVGLAGAGLCYDHHRRREGERLAALRIEALEALAKGREALGLGRWTDGRLVLSPLLTRIDAEPKLADLQAGAADLLDRINRGLAAQEARRSDQERYRQFLRYRDEALFHETRFTGLTPPGDLDSARQAARAALALFASPAAGCDESWTPSPIPDSLSAQERAKVETGCYQLLLVLAEAVAQPGPGEDPGRQADQAIRILDRAAALQAPTRAYHLRRAACLERKGDAAGAERERRAAGRLRPVNAFDHLLSGQAYFEHHEWSTARLHLDHSLRLQPDQFWPQVLLAVCDLQTQRPAEAKVRLTACLQRRPDFVWLYLLRSLASGEEGYLLQEQARRSHARSAQLESEAEALFEAAEADYRTVLTLGPGDDDRYALLVNRGCLRVRRHRLDEAVTDLQAATRLKPRHFMAYVALAQAYQQQGRRDEAVAQLSKAIDLKSDLAALFRSRALVRSRQVHLTPSDSAAILRDLDEAIRLAPPGSPETAHDHTQRGLLLQREGRHQEVLDACEAALKLVPDDPESHRLRIQALLELRRYDDVIQSCDGYLARGQPTAAIVLLRGLAKAGRADLPGAIQDYTQALTLQPGQSSLHAHRGWAYLVSDAPGLALSDFEEALRLDPDNSDAYNGRGLARALRGAYREAVADAEESLRHGTPTARTLYNAARIYARAAVAVGDATRGSRPDHVPFSVLEGYLDRAQVLLRRSLERLPAEQRTTFWRDVIQADPALQAIRRRPKFSTLAAQFAQPAD